MVKINKYYVYLQVIISYKLYKSTSNKSNVNIPLSVSSYKIEKSVNVLVHILEVNIFEEKKFDEVLEVLIFCSSKSKITLMGLLLMKNRLCRF